jgi:hypothetical protein
MNPDEQPEQPIESAEPTLGELLIRTIDGEPLE